MKIFQNKILLMVVALMLSAAIHTVRYSVDWGDSSTDVASKSTHTNEKTPTKNAISANSLKGLYSGTVENATKNKVIFEITKSEQIKNNRIKFEYNLKLNYQNILNNEIGFFNANIKKFSFSSLNDENKLKLKDILSIISNSEVKLSSINKLIIENKSKDFVLRQM